MSILCLHYHQARLYRQIARSLETVNHQLVSPRGGNGGRKEKHKLAK